MSLNGANRSNYLARLVPNLSRLIPDEAGNMMMGNNGYGGSASNSDSMSSPQVAGGGGVSSLNYEDSDLNAITRSQMNQDLLAYRYDLDFCQLQLNTQPDLSPQEIRTLQIRILDCGHNIRHCRHRIQTLDAQARLGIAPYATGTYRATATSGVGAYRAAGANGGTTTTSKHKRARTNKSDAELDGGHAIENDDGEPDADADADAEVSMMTDDSTPVGAPTHTLQRLGYWDCRLCRSRKYLEAGPNRVPSAPCKWPLKDISKMINHFLDLHTEHSPAERCSELGDALARNRGPFEYWLTRTKAQDIDNVAVIDEYIRTLQEGSLPQALRGLLRAATMFPNLVSNSYKK